MQALIFDMDGLMIDSERLYFQVERDLARRYHTEVADETLGKMMGRNPLDSIRIFVEDLQLPLEPEEALRLRDAMMRKKLQTDLEAMPGLFHILDAFSGRLKMAVCTGAPREFLDIVLSGLKIEDRFSVLQTSDGIARGKPDPQIYLTTCQRLQAPPADCIVLEDSSNGVKAAKRAGCCVIAVPSEYTRHQDFTYADHCVPDLFKAEKHIQGMLAAQTG